MKAGHAFEQAGRYTRSVTGLFLLSALALLVIPPAILITAPLRWLTLLVPAGIAAFVVAIHLVGEGDPGPAGLIILGFIALLLLLNGAVLFGRLLKHFLTDI